MAVSELWRASIRGLEIGAGTSYEIDPDGIRGIFGLPTSRSSDQDRADQDGAVGSRDRYQRRTITIPLGILGASPSDAGALLRSLKDAWRREDSLEEIELEVRVPGLPGNDETLSYFGRPRGMTVDGRLLRSSTLRALLTFEALDPLAYGPEESQGPDSGGFTVTNDGDEPTDRVVLVVAGNGGTPSIVNADDEGGDITFAQALGGGASRTIDLRARTVTDGGTDHYDELSPVSSWFSLVSGDNDLTLSGAASVTTTFLPAYG